MVVAALTRTQRGLVSELVLTPADEGDPTECVVNFDNVHTLARETFRRRVIGLSPARMAHAFPDAAKRHRLLSAVRVADESRASAESPWGAG